MGYLLRCCGPCRHVLKMSFPPPVGCGFAVFVKQQPRMRRRVRNLHFTDISSLNTLHSPNPASAPPPSHHDIPTAAAQRTWHRCLGNLHLCGLPIAQTSFARRRPRKTLPFIFVQCGFALLRRVWNETRCSYIVWLEVAFNQQLLFACGLCRYAFWLPTWLAIYASRVPAALSSGTSFFHIKLLPTYTKSANTSIEKRVWYVLPLHLSVEYSYI